jgi:hypothetical protein
LFVFLKFVKQVGFFMSANDRKMDDMLLFGGAHHKNAAQSKVASRRSNQKALSWKHIGDTRLEFTSSVLTTSLDCSVSRGSLLSTPVPKRLLSQRIVPWRHAQNKEGFLLKSNTNNQNLDIKTINAMLMSVKSAMLFQDAQDSCQTFAYVPRSLSTASLMEYNNTQKTTSTTLEEKIAKKTTPKKVSTVSIPEKEMTNTSLTAVNEMDPVPIEAVEPDKLETLYQSCLDTNEPTPRIFSRIVAKSLVDMNMVGNWLVSSFQIQNESTDNPRLLPLQTCLRLALAPNAKFLKLYYKVTCNSAVSSKKSRKRLKKMSPQEVLLDQVFNLLSLLAIRCCDSPVDFENLVKELCIGVSQDVVKVIFDCFEFHEKEKEQEPTTKMERLVPAAVTPATTTTTKTTVKDPILPRNEPLLAIQQENMAHSETNDAMSIIKQDVSLTQCRSTRKNSLVPNQKRKYVGSHFASGLSNVSTLFRQVKVLPKATATAVAPEERMKPTIQLEPARRRRLAGDGPPLKRPRTIVFERAKQVITETPAKKLVYPSPHSSFSPMRADSQNARLLAQQALAAARRKL